MSRNCAFLSILLAVALGTGLFRKAPAEPVRRSVSLVVPNTVPAPDVLSGLGVALSAYREHPSSELAEHVRVAFAAIDARLADLRQRAAASSGGPRAELVIQSIELERERDAQMRRFSEANAQAAAGDLRQNGEEDGLRFVTTTARRSQ